MSTHVEIENTRTGQRKTVSMRSWELLATAKESGNIRKGYRLVTEVDRKPAAEPDKAQHAASLTMIPPAIAAAAEAARLAEQQAEAVAMSGAKIEAPAPAQEAAKEAPAADPQPEAPAEEQAPAELPTELVSLDDSLTAKVAQVLAQGGITTKAQLNAAPLPKINQLLDQAGLSGKKAQAPGWKTKAAGK